MNAKLIVPTALVAALTFSAVPAFAQHRGNGGSRGSTSARSYRGGGPVRVAPRVVVSSRGYGYGYYRPYYSFRPRVSLGFGLWVGYPVAYPSYYGYPYDYGYAYDPRYPSAYDYPAPPPYGYPSQSSNYPPGSYPSGSYPSSNYPASNYPSSNYPSSSNPASRYPADDQGGPAYESPSQGRSVTVQPGGQPSGAGGVSFEISPDSASVFVDGKYMGTGAEFGPSSRPLDLTSGRHRIEVRAEGYQSLSFDADVRAGQVLPYQATLQRR